MALRATRQTWPIVLLLTGASTSFAFEAGWRQGHILYQTEQEQTQTPTPQGPAPSEPNSEQSESEDDEINSAIPQ